MLRRRCWSCLFFFFVLGGCGLYLGGPSGTKPETDGGIEEDADDSGLPAVPFVPSHTMTMFSDAAIDLVNPTAIDTDSLAIAFGGATLPPPTGVSFLAEGSRAVLRVGAFTASVNVRVVGTRSLIIVASRAATIGGKIDAAARLGSSGPGGAAPGNGQGAGATAIGGAMCNGGGGGASFGDIGGPGGMTSCGSSAAAGVAHGNKRTDFLGGSGGGTGGGSCGGIGGAGGGALQISSLVAVRVVASGSIATSGGGGSGGCGGPDHGGGGGGSGGTIFLEAPVVEIAGTLAANGGGGGEGGSSIFIISNKDGDPGADGLVDVTPALGGAHMNTDRAGGAGGAKLGMAQPGMAGADTTGGGGGGVGRIWLRTRAGVPASPTGKVSPTPTLDPTL